MITDSLAQSVSQLVRHVRPAPRYTSYPTVPHWNDGVRSKEFAESLANSVETAEEPLSIYVHLPFCRERCAYCGCNVIVTERPERADRYLGYLGKELELVSKYLGGRRRFAQLHLGGGTPTFLSAAQFKRLDEILRRHFDRTDGAEMALEADPRVTSVEQLKLLRTLGFNRISLGVQDFDPAVQEYIGRVQSLEQTRRVFESAREFGFRGINVDLVYGLPKQTAAGLNETLQHVLAMKPDRISFFGYAHVPEMLPHQRVFDGAVIPDAKQRIELCLMAHHVILSSSYQRVGMDHFARLDDELAVAEREGRLHRNFQGYTVFPAKSLLGLGVTSISDIDGTYAQNAKTLSEYYQALDRGEFATERGHVLSAEDRLRRNIIMTLMCHGRANVADMCETAGYATADELLSDSLPYLAALSADGLIVREGWQVEATEPGLLFIRNIAAAFDVYWLRQSTRATHSPTV